MKSATLIKNIKAFLKDKGILETVDTTLVEELAYSKELCEMAKADITTRGYLINVAAADKTPYYQPNPSIGIYNTALKSIAALSTKLGITVLDRTKLGLESQEEDDDLSKVLSE
jgi:P27 family predicted phage terminase small subunit